MNINDLYRKNEKLQESAAHMVALVPDTDLLTYTTIIMRGAKRINIIFPNLIAAQTEMQFGSIMDKLEDQIDEVIYGLDRITLMNRKQKLTTLDEFVKAGYNMISLYSFACDKIIERRLTKEVI